MTRLEQYLDLRNLARQNLRLLQYEQASAYYLIAACVAPTRAEAARMINGAEQAMQLHRKDQP